MHHESNLETIPLEDLCFSPDLMVLVDIYERLAEVMGSKQHLSVNDTLISIPLKIPLSEVSCRCGVGLQPNFLFLQMSNHARGA